MVWHIPPQERRAQVDMIRWYVPLGYTSQEIADQIGTTRRRVEHLKRSEGITSAYGPGRRPGVGAKPVQCRDCPNRTFDFEDTEDL